MFCSNFNSLNEALREVGGKKCKNCENLIYSEGIETCSKMNENIENTIVNYNEEGK